MSKNDMKNSGISLYVDVEKDLTPIKGALIDSWYVKSDFECDGKIFGFTWHQGVLNTPLKKLFSSECVFMNVSDDQWVNKDFSASVSKLNGMEADKLNIYSQWGYLRGDVNHMELRVDTGKYCIDVQLTRKKNVLYNGATGLIDFGSVLSYEYAFPDMKMEGTFTFDGKKYLIKNATAWFDRQWGKMTLKGDKSDTFMPGKSTWLWLGLFMKDDDNTVLSLWDLYTNKTRRSFVTATGESEYQLNTNADIKYHDIWISSKTGFHYPGIVEIKAQGIELDVTLTCCTSSKEIEFQREQKGLSGCQCLFKAVGTYKGNRIDCYANLEMIGDLCG